MRAEPVAARPDQVTLQLKWHHQFQFAGYYAAQARGFYGREGLEVVIAEGGAGKSAVDAVLRGAAQFGVADSDLVLARMQGQPLVACAAIFQHSPYVLLSRRDRDIRTPGDLVGAKVMMADDQGAIQFRAMLIQEGIDPQRVEILKHSWNLSDLIDRKVDAMSAYATVEPARLLALGVAPSFLRSRDYGVDFYGDTLFTTESELAAGRQRVAAFRRASLAGWDYGMAHPQEIAELIVTLPGVADRGITLDMLLREASAMRPFILPDVVEIGHMNPGRWQHVAETFAILGLAPRTDSLAGFLFDPEPPANPARVRWTAGLGIAGLLVAALVVFWNLQMRLRVRARTLELNQEVLQRQETERELRASERRVGVTFDAAPAGIVMTTTAGQFVLVNPAFYATLGYAAGELATADLWALIHPEDRGDLDQSIAALLAGSNACCTFEKRFLTKDGGAVWLRASMSLVRSADGHPNSVIVVTEDISSRKAAEHRLRLLSGALEAAANAIVITDLQGRIEWINPAFTASTGYDAAEAAGRRVGDLLGGGGEGEGFHRAIWETIASGSVWRGELVNKRKDGSLYWEEVTITPLRDDSGELTHFISVKQDISERRRADAQVREQASLLDRAQDAISVRDLEHRITYWNKSAERLYGWSVAEAVGASMADLLYQGDSAFGEASAAVLRHGEWAGELTPSSRGARAVIVESRMTLVRDAAGEPHSILAISTDITERKKIEAQFLRSQRLESIGTLAGGIAHDLNNVLAPILLSIELLRARATDPRSLRLLRTIEGSAQRGADMVKQVLAFARGVEGVRTPISLGDLIRDLQAIIAETFPKSILCHTDVAPELWQVVGDPTQLHQVLMNLCLNARDAMPNGGTLDIGAANTMIDEPYVPAGGQERAGPHVLLQVRDSGTGIPPQVIDRIFDPFFTSKDVGKGTGLGLSTVATIVKNHGGFVRVESEAGEGAAFQVFLPAVENAL